MTRGKGGGNNHISSNIFLHYFNWKLKKKSKKNSYHQIPQYQALCSMLISLPYLKVDQNTFIYLRTLQSFCTIHLQLKKNILQRLRKLPTRDEVWNPRKWKPCHLHNDHRHVWKLDTACHSTKKKKKNPRPSLWKLFLCGNS